MANSLLDTREWRRWGSPQPPWSGQEWPFFLHTAKHRKRFSQVDKGDEVEYNGFNLNAREKCYVSNLAQGKGVF
jgi:hypothetical protein